MIHQLRDKKQIARRKDLIRNVIIFGLFLVLFITGILTWSGKFFNFIGQPIWKAKNSIIDSANSAGYLVNTKASIFKENENLKKENDA